MVRAVSLEPGAVPPPVTPREREACAWQVLGEVQDPEIPVLSVIDLGVIRRVYLNEAGTLEVNLAPTYSGCPASLVIRSSVVAALRAAGFESLKVLEVLSPPWSSDWLSEAGRQKLKGYGIAPPAESVASPRALWRTALIIACPRCDSRDTTSTSQFGSTPCKALYRCNACLEPFEYFKCI